MNNINVGIKNYFLEEKMLLLWQAASKRENERRKDKMRFAVRYNYLVLGQ